MTTIVYKDGIIAYDSFQTRGDIITNDNCNKLHIVNGIKFLLTGSVCDYPEFLSIAIGESQPRDGFELDVEGLMVKGGKLYNCAIQDKFWQTLIKREDIYAIGSGRNFAYTAMDCGLSARDAVKMAIKRDLYSGGRVRTIKL